MYWGVPAGWLSATVGFAAPIALAAMALGKYFHGVAGGGPSETSAALVIATALTLVHLRGTKLGALFQSGVTVFNLALIAVFIGAGWF